MSRKFVHLHVHSEYSLLDGACRVEELPLRAAELGMDSVAITDHGVMYGAVEFYKACQKAGVRPIIGCEIYVAPRSRFQREPKIDDENFHLVVLAADQEGYRNLVRLVSLASLEGFYYKPRVDKELLARHARGLIALTSCLGGEVPKRLLRGQHEDALRAAADYMDIFGRENFFVELQDHGIPEQRRVNPELIALARRLGVGLVATNDVHYLNREDAQAHDVLVCIQTGKTVDDPSRLRYPGGQFYLKPAQEMEELFRDWPEALDNTAAIAERCRVDFRFGQVHLPHYELPEGYDAAGYLRRLCAERLPRRYPELAEAARCLARGGGVEEAVDVTPPGARPVVERLYYELSVIEKMGYPGYFLIVQDFISHARSRGIAVGPGRGSAAGSLVAYVLGITGIDPLRYNLLFERFLNPERVSMPDMDIDFDDRRRGEVIDYVRERYGEERVAQIITFGRMLARAVIRDVGRALGMPYGEVDKIAKMVPAALGMTLEKALELSPELREAYQGRPEVRTLVDLARRLEGLPRHASVHAAGVVIARDPLMDHVPLQRMADDRKGEGVVVTQFPMNILEELGLLKFDFLGLRTLSVIEEASRMASEVAGRPIDPYALPLDDPPTYSLLGEGQTAGVFQLESSGMREMLRDLKPTCLEDIIAAVALYRPGPMENIPEFIRSKHEGNVKYLHPLLEPILKDTYGIMVYQEQIMQVASAMAGFTLGQADILRRAVGKKKKEVLDAQREAFVAGCVRQGHPKKLAEELYDLIVKFANYGFNRSHAAAYGYLAYITAWLKANFPAQFMAALLTSVADNSDKVAEYIRECQRMAIPVLPPDVNESRAEFAVIGGRIRYGLAAVKNVGMAAVESIIAARERGGPFRSLSDFLTRVDTRTVNRRAVESLIKAGALDALGARRAQLLEILETAMQRAQEAQSGRATGQVSLFDALGPLSGPGLVPVAEVPLPPVAEYPTNRLLAMEKEVLGLYLSGHPLAGREAELAARASSTIANLGELPEGERVAVAGLVMAVRRVMTRGGEQMAFVTLEDLSGQVEVALFPRTLARCRELVQEDALVVVSGRVSWRDEQVTVVAEEVAALGDGAAETAAAGEGRGERPALFLRVQGDAGPDVLARIKEVLASYPGRVPVYLWIAAARKAILADRRYWIEPQAALLGHLEALLGQGSVTWYNNAPS